MKEMEGFSEEVMSGMVVVSVAGNSDVLLVMGMEGRRVMVRRLERSFFKGWGCKMVREVIGGDGELGYGVGFVEMPMALKEKYFGGAYGNCTIFCCLMVTGVAIILIDTLYYNTDNFAKVLYQSYHSNPSLRCHASFSETVLHPSSNLLTLVLTFSFGKELYQLYPTAPHSPSQWTPTSSLLNNKTIIFLQYLHPYELLLIHEDTTLNLYYTKEINWMNNSTNCSTSALSYTFNERIRGGVVAGDGEGKGKGRSYLTTMFYEGSTGEVYCLEGGGIGTYQLAGWRGVIAGMKEEGGLEGGMKLLVAMYLGVNKYQMGFGRGEKEMGELGEWVKKMVEEYCSIKFPKYKSMSEEEITTRYSE